jgi:hypothetical protein
MWFSSGNTSSVTHTDDYENILCVIDGRKELILVDYYRFEDIANVIVFFCNGYVIKKNKNLILKNYI